MNNQTEGESVATFKLLLIGNSGVGKSSILLRFTEDTFLPPDEVSATIGVDFKVNEMVINDKLYKLTLWDTAGQERFRTLTSSYYRGAHGVILVYDVSNAETFENLEQWFAELDTYCKNRDIAKLVIGNKVDKESNRVVSAERGRHYANEKGCLFMECSAKTKLGIQDGVESLVRKIIETPSLWQKKVQTTIDVSKPNITNEESYGACSC